MYLNKYPYSPPINCISIIPFSHNTQESLIGEALNSTNFLEEWSILFAIHEYYKYFKYHEKEGSLYPSNNESQDNIRKELDIQNENIIFCEINKQYTFKKGYIYILPDSESINPRTYDITGFLYSIVFQEKQNSVTFFCEKKAHDFSTWLNNNRLDASKTIREVKAIDIKKYDKRRHFKIPFLQFPDPSEDINSENNIKFANFSQKIKENFPDKKIMYRDLPCIDYVMEKLCEVQNIKIAALLLCGCYGDGAYGLKQISDKGYPTAVQDPTECKCEHQRANQEMPETALKISKNHQIITLGNAQSIRYTNTISLIDWLEKYYKEILKILFKSICNSLT